MVTELGGVTQPSPGSQQPVRGPKAPLQALQLQLGGAAAGLRKKELLLHVFRPPGLADGTMACEAMLAAIPEVTSPEAKKLAEEGLYAIENPLKLPRSYTQQW
jgi:hypothetical protein